MPVCGIGARSRDNARSGNCGSPERTQGPSRCLPSVFRSNFGKAIHQPLPQASDVCRPHGEAQNLSFNQRNGIGEAVSMKIKDRLSELPYGEEEHERI